MRNLHDLTIRLLLVSGFLLSPVTAHAETVTVAVAANFLPAMRDIANAFNNTSDHHVQLSSGSSGKFYAQIINGAPFDMFFSADQAKPLALEAEGLSVPGSRRTYAEGELVLWTTRRDLKLDGAAALKHGRFGKLALANPRLAPYGAAAVQVLEHLGLADSSRQHWVMGENIAQTYQFVATGNADLGFVALAQALSPQAASAGRSWPVPGSWHAPIQQDAVLLRDSPAARTFYAFVASDAATSIIRRYGYRIPTRGQAANLTP